MLPGMSSLAPLKQIGLLIAIAASIALGVYIAMWSREPAMRPLPSLTPEASMDVINYLEQQQIPYKVDTTGRLLVPQSRFKRIQIELGSQGIPLQENSNDSFLNKDSGFGVSQRMEKARLLRSQELQLTSTLQQFSGVKAVKVHLAIPKESSFIKNRRKPSASVFLQLYSRGGLGEEQVSAMVDMVAGSVPNMERNRVTITDQFGRLHHSGSMSSLQRQTSKELSVTRERQQDIKNRIEQILNPIVGLAAYTVQVNVDMDFTKTEQTLQTFNPDLPAVRSERTIDDTRTNGAASGIPGALTNQPPGQGTTNPQGNNQQGGGQNTPVNKRVEAERNFDLDTTISHIKPQVGTVNRISVSVGLDHIADPNNEGQKIARDENEMARITRLIRAAIGFSVSRGDIVSVESFPFISAEPLPAPAPVEFYQEELFQTLLKPVIGLILGLVLIFVVLKPAYRKLSTAPPVIAGTSGSGSGMAGADELDMSGLEGGGDLDGLASDQVMLAGHENLELPPPTVGEVKKLETAKGIVSNNPTLVAQLVKNWIEDDG
jgi:flagellar M-ring protein FliF